MPGASSDLSPDAVLFGRLGDKKTAAGEQARLLASLDIEHLSLKYHYHDLQTDQGIFSGTYFWGARRPALPAEILPEENTVISTVQDHRGYLPPAIKDVLRMLSMADHKPWQMRCRLEPMKRLTSDEAQLERVLVGDSDALVGTIDTPYRQAVEKLSAATDDAVWRYLRVETMYTESVDGRDERRIQTMHRLVLYGDHEQVLGWVNID